MERRVDISNSPRRTRLFPALLVMARDTGLVFGTSFDPSEIKKMSLKFKILQVLSGSNLYLNQYIFYGLNILFLSLFNEVKHWCLGKS